VDTKSDIYVCPNCGYIYYPDKGDNIGGIPSGTAFEDLPDDWECPVCGTPKQKFRKKKTTL
jgi:rubredoxin